ncbi:MAG: DNA-binding protein [Anaerolinea sp.]|nr:DNA-binding protein [Anaerolinea sp.]
MAARPSNDDIAAVLERIAELLETQDANPFRVRAYRDGAQTLRNADRSAADLAAHGHMDELKALPNIGSGIAAVIGEYVSSGQSSLLRDLEARVSPEAVIARVPGIGTGLAARIVEALGVETLADLEDAAHDGRLATVEGFGAKRVENVRTALAGMLSRSAQTRQQERASANGDRPSIDLLLSIDAEYRRRADDDLPKIAPRRFNPNDEAWLPILRTKRDGYDFTVLFSNTARAHELDKTHDWVVIYFERDGKERQHTVVTETSGALKGKRVVRGREPETRRYYDQ